MQLAVSTLTCPVWDLHTIATKFQEYGLEAVDFRGLQKYLNLADAPEFAEERIPTTLQFLREHHLHVSGISTSVKLVNEATLDEGFQNLDLAAHCQASYIRVMAGKVKNLQEQSAMWETILNNYKKLLAYAEKKNVQVLLETHDEMSKSTDIRNVIDAVNHPLAGIIWDVRHPFHLYQESFAYTVSVLGERIKVVHVKDFDQAHDSAIVLFGSGDFDPEVMMKELKTINYNGYLVLEIPKRHRHHLPEADEMIPQFMKVMKPFV